MLKISLIDRSLYFKGLLLLIRKDAQISDPEMILMKQIGQYLGFETEFCDTAIRDILTNEHIVDSPPVFSTPEIAVRFIRDGITISHCDHDIHPKEWDWLESVAKINQLDFVPLFEKWKKDHFQKELIPIEAEMLTV
ncbi:MAG: hypothetical protein LCH54_05365 [Bacteroidetes bacterium]|nr:hypothetical protein [Bacteroidota bacterium]